MRASKKVPEYTKENYPEIPWRLMAGMRDELIHDYFGVDIEVIWKTATEDIEEIKPPLKEIIEEYK